MVSLETRLFWQENPSLDAASGNLWITLCASSVEPRDKSDLGQMSPLRPEANQLVFHRCEARMSSKEP